MVILSGEKIFDVRDFGMEPPRILLFSVAPDVTVKVAIVAEKDEDAARRKARLQEGRLTCTSSGCAPRSWMPSSSGPAIVPWHAVRIVSAGCTTSTPRPSTSRSWWRHGLRRRGRRRRAGAAPVSVRCTSCGAVTEGDELPLACVECSSVDLEIVGGDELILESIEYRAPTGRRAIAGRTAMCLGIPGQVVELLDEHEHLARVDVSGVGRIINIGLLEDEDVRCGDWVLIHVGFAMSKIDEEEARLALASLQMLGEVYDDEVEAMFASPTAKERRHEVRRRVPRPAAAHPLVAHITELAGDDHFKFMEVCGGHTHTIYRHGIEHVLPDSIELVHGPGCPVCVIPMGRVDDAIAVAETPGTIFTSFGDMMRVPGGNGNLLEAKARGADVRFVYSPLDALKIAQANPERDVVFFAVGFEHGTVDGRHAPAGAGARSHELQGLLQPRDDRAADQGDPRVA